MTTPGRHSRSGRGSSDDDKALWEAAAETVTPLARPKPRVHAALDQASGVGAPAAAPRKDTATAAKPAGAQKPPPAPSLPRPTSPPLADFDPKAARRIRSGRLEIERRVDLHGMRQSEAHMALRRFLLDCHARGMRMVLVITGKGAPSRGGDDGVGREARGVIKRNVPMWLAEPDMRAIVVSYREAAPQHGGEGALYVHLRRSDRVSGRR
jgi:DNA-nicking Smr family endonuclease